MDVTAEATRRLKAARAYVHNQYAPQPDLDPPSALLMHCLWLQMMDFIQ